MITSLITLLIVALVLCIVWYVVGIFIKDGTIMRIIGIIMGLVLLLYGLRLFKIALPLLVLTFAGCETTQNEDGSSTTRFDAEAFGSAVDIGTKLYREYQRPAYQQPLYYNGQVVHPYYE